MKIETAKVAGDVDDFTDKEQAGDFPTFHRFAGEFARVDAAGGDFGFGVAFGTGGQDAPQVQVLFEIGEGRVGPRGRRVAFEPTRSQTLGKKVECGADGGWSARGDGAKSGGDV